MLKRLYELRDYARHNIDTVVSVGIGGSYLGSKVIFDVQCGAFWNNLQYRRTQRISTDVFCRL